MHETSKAMIRRNFDNRFATRWLVGDGVDIGAGRDSVGLYRAMLPDMRGPPRSVNLTDLLARFRDRVSVLARRGRYPMAAAAAR